MDPHLVWLNQTALPCKASRGKARPAYQPPRAWSSHGVKAKPGRVANLAYILLLFAFVPTAHATGQVLSSTEASNQELLREQERSRALRQQLERAPDVHLR
jgi:hypothetical protein